MPNVYAHPLAPTSNEGGMEIERVECGNGMRVYLRGYEHPWKGFPSEGAVNAVNVVKKMLFEGLKLRVLVLTPRKSIKAFFEITEKVIGPHILLPEFQNPMTAEIKSFLENLGLEARNAQNLAHIIEYDSAYRLRLQDLFSETTKEALAQRPITEIRRLLSINRRRDYTAVHAKFRRLANLAILVLLIPWYRSRFKKAIMDSHFINLQLDVSDRWWLNQRSDYGPGNLNPIL